MTVQRLVLSKAAGALALGLAAVAAAPLAQARDNVSWSVTIGNQGHYGYAPPPVVYAPPVYVQPRPVYVQPRPVYVQPPVIYGAPPVYVAPQPVYGANYYYGPPGHWKHKHKHKKHWKHHRDHDDD